MKISISLILSAMTSVMIFAETYNVQPGNGSFEKAAKRWKRGDTILLAPGEYQNKLRSGGFGSTKDNGGLTIKAAIPGSVVFRGDLPAPNFTSAGNRIWKTHFEKMPETVFERDTLTPYTYCGTHSELLNLCGAWTYDARQKILYIRTTDSEPPEKHCLSVGVTPDSCINFFSHPDGKGNTDILLDGFTVTGYYSRIMFPDQRLPFSQKKVPWGVVVSHAEKNVVIRNVTAVLNGEGIGLCNNNRNAVIEHCRAFGNQNPFVPSGGGIGAFNGYLENVKIQDCVAGDNHNQDIYLYSTKAKASSVFARNHAYCTIRVKCTKEKGFAVRHCVANRYSHIGHPRYLQNSVSFSHFDSDNQMTDSNLLMFCEKDMKPEDIFADPANFDCRPQNDVPQSVLKRGIGQPSDKLFFVTPAGNDSANGLSVKNAFSSLAKAGSALNQEGAELYITGPITGNLKLKNLKNVAIRGRGRYPAKITGKIELDHCSGVTLERLMPDEIDIKDSDRVAITQSIAKLEANQIKSLRLKHNYFPKAKLKNSSVFVTANIFGTKKTENISGWSDYNAYAAAVPSNEKHSYTAVPQMGKNGTFRNAWQFDGRSIDVMPVGPYRRQKRCVTLKMDPVQIKSLTPNSAEIVLSANLPFEGTLQWGKDKKCSHRVQLSGAASYSIGLPDLKPGQKYYYYYRVRSDVSSSYSNGETASADAVTRTAPISFSTPKSDNYLTKEYFVSPSGSDESDGTANAPFATISCGVTKLLPGDTLTIRGGNYTETINVPVSGTKEKPITIRAAKGERVRLNGGFGCALQEGFRICSQNYLILEDLFIIGKYLNKNDGYENHPVYVQNCRNITFRRLFVGGGTHKIRAISSKNILVEDSIFTGGHEGLMACDTSITIRRCCFVFAGVNQITLRNSHSEKCIIEDCVIFDMINKKGGCPLVHVHDIAALTERNNCFYTRLDPKHKRIYGWNMNGKELAEKTVPEQIGKFPYLGRRQVSYDTYLKDTNREAVSFFANPGVKARPKILVTYNDLNDWKKNYEKNEKTSWDENRLLKQEEREMRENYMPTNPEVLKRGCGPRIK